MRRKLQVLKIKMLVLAMAVASCCYSQGWQRKADFNGGQKSYAFSFVIGSKAYVGTGLNAGQVSNDLWEYNPASDTWTQLADFIGKSRYNAVSFVIGTKGYIGTGATVFQIGSTNFYEYDPAANSWRARASLANGLQRTGAVGFAIGSKGYIGLGRNNTYFKNDLWEFDPTLNKWTQRASYPGSACADATAFTIGSKAYVGLGNNATTAFRTFYEYSPASNSWAVKTQLPSLIRSGASAMVIGNKGYVALGSSYTTDVWEYDPAINQWKRKMNFAGPERKSAAAFAVNGKGYIVGGMLRNIYYNDVWEYSVDTCRISALAKPHVKPSLCLYDSIMMSANADSGLAYQWRLNGNDIQGANGRYYYAKTPGIYSVALSGNYICSNISSGINVIKPCNETPAVAEAGADKRICVDDSAFLKGAVSGSATNASWSGGNGIFLPNNDSLLVTYIPTADEFAAGRVKLYLTTNDPDSTGPISAGIDSVNIYISTGPPAPGNINGPWCFCANSGNYIYSVPAEKGVVYSWVVSDDAAINSGQGSGSINVSYTANAISDTVFVTSTNGCGTSPEKYIVVNLITGLPAPTPPISGINVGCPGTSSRYSVTRTNDAIGYTWTPPKGATINGSSGPVTTADTSVNILYSKYYNGDTLKVKAVNCFGSLTEERMVIPRKYVDPPAEIIGSTIGCMNDSNIYKINKVPYGEYYIWSLPIGATIKGKSLTYSSPDTVVTIVFTGAFSSDSIKVKAVGCAGMSGNTSLMINRSTGASNCHGCTLSAKIGTTQTHCAGDSVRLSSSYTGAGEICNACDRYATGVYNFTGIISNSSASLSTPDGIGTWFKKGSSGTTTSVTWNMGEVIPAGTTVTVGVKTDGCSGNSVKSMMQFWILTVDGAGQETLLSQSAVIAYYSSKFREFSFNTTADCRYVALSDEGGCGIRVDYIKWKKSCCTSSSAVTYLWSTGETTAAISVTPAKSTNYWVKVSDKGGCMSTDNVTVNIVDKPIARINGIGLKCPGSIIQLCADSAVSYKWSDGSTNQCIVAGTAGKYMLTVTNGVCTVSDSIEVKEVAVSDNNECTTDACESLTGQVTHTGINLNDNNACTTDACDPVSGPSHVTINVDDNNVCTIDGCNTLTGPYHDPVNTDDNNACTTDACNTSTGVHHTKIDVNDGNLCTIDACNSITGAITHTAIDLNDNNICTTDICDPDSGPSHIAVNVDDNNSCTTDACDPVAGISHSAINSDDNNVCTTDGCNAATGVYHNPVNIDDQNACTTDGCNASAGIYHTPINVNDNNVCTVDACNTSTGTVTHIAVNLNDNNVCTTDACDYVTGVSHIALNVNDNNACTTDACDPITGVSHIAVNTDDNNVCTTDVCNTVTGAITHVSGNINDNNICTTDACDPQTGVSHIAINVNDNNSCTTDACDPVTGITHTAVNLNDNNSCTTDACDPVSGISHTNINVNDNNSCTTDACDPVTGVTHTAINVNDNNACTADACNPVSGVSHAAINLNDNDACTTDACDPVTGVTHAAFNVNDNNVCTTDACNSLTGAISHIAVNVNDNNICTTDACDPVTGVTHALINMNDNNACTADACDPVSGVTHAFINVNDNNACTVDACNSLTGAILHNAININDNNACTTDNCDQVTGPSHIAVSVNDNNECTTDACNSVTGSITHLAVNVNDNNVCTIDGCNLTTGVYHNPIITEDQNACTTDGCNTTTGVFHTPANVNDNSACTIDACNSLTGAITHTSIIINDNNACTTDACDPLNGPVYTAINFNDNNACTTDACDPATGPSHIAIVTDDNNECTMDGCIPSTGVFHNTVTSDDHDKCTTDGCDPQTGVYYNSIDVDDNNECTVDACNPLTGIITHVAIDIDDANVCTKDACDAILGQSHTPVNIDDNNVCTTDNCDSIKGISHLQTSTNDNNVCTTDGCNSITGVYHTLVKVDDGNICTTDACNPTTGVITHTIFGLPADPTISGTTVVCAGSQWSYKAKGTAGITSYTWTIPSGVTILSGQGTDSIVVKYSSQFVSGNICSMAKTTCGNSKSVCLPITLFNTVPVISGSISGQQLGVCIGTTWQYCIASQANTSSYLWTVPANSQIISGAGTNCIIVKFLTGFKSGNITVKAQNCAGNSTAVSLAITSIPAIPGAISGPISSLNLKKGVVYSVSAVGGATSYSWSVPTAASITSGQGTRTITVDFKSGFVSGRISVFASNSCGNGSTRYVSIKAAAASTSAITGATTVCANDKGIAYEVAAQNGVTFTWTVPAGATIASGQGTASILVNWGSASGYVAVTAGGVTKSQSVIVNSCLKNSNIPFSFADPELFVKPNPTKADFSLVFKAEKEMEYRIVIRDMVGKVIYSDKLTSIEGMNIQSIKTDGFAKGLYILTLSGEKVSESLRLAID